MTTSFSTNLGLINITTGTESGLWGNYTNTNICTLLEQAVSGYSTFACTGGTDTLTMTGGASATARNAYLKLTGTGGGNLVVPDTSKIYFINNTSSGAVTVKGSVAGVSVPQNYKVVLVSDGAGTISEAISIISASGVFASVTVNGSSVPVNGMYLPSANTLGWSTNSTFRMSIDGNGVWTLQAPSVNNHVVNLASGTNGIAFTTGTRVFNIYANATDTYIGTTSNHPVNFVSNGALRGTMAVTGTAWTLNGIAGTHSTKIADSAGTTFEAGYLGAPQSSNTTLALSDRGKGVNASGTITVPNGVFSFGDIVMVYNNTAGNITLTAGITTMRLAGTATTGSRTIAQRGWAAIFFVSSSECSVGGMGVT